MCVALVGSNSLKISDCFIGALTKNVLFGGISLKVSVLCDLNFDKNCIILY